jgi:hypothetical protein
MIQMHDPDLLRFPSDDSPSLLGCAGLGFLAGLALRSKQNLMIVMVARYWQPNLTARYEQIGAPEDDRAPLG